jgi:Glycosyltransferase family 87
VGSTKSIGDASAGVKRQAKKHSPVFIAVYLVFFLATIVIVAGVLIGILSAKPSHHDTQWFWASGHLLVHGHNPYDREALRQIELSLGLPLKNQVMMTLNPPFALFLLVPLGLLTPTEGVFAWSLLLAAFLILSVLSVRAMVGHPYDRNYLLLAWCFAPALCCIEVGQTGLITLLGLALFLRFHDTRPLWAGAALSLCAVKPHLLLPFGVALLAWIVVRKKWMIVSGAILALVVESLVAMAFDHAIWAHYRAMMRTERFVDEFIPTLSVGLRFLLDRQAMWLEFIPAALGCAWALWYFWRNREKWDWTTHGSLVTLVSLMVAPYAWLTDQVLAIPAILFVFLSATPPRKGSLTLLLAVMTATELQMMMTKTLFFKPDMLLGVVWVAWYLYAKSGAKSTIDAVATA